MQLVILVHFLAVRNHILKPKVCLATLFACTICMQLLLLLNGLIKYGL